jgi:hypothetical protein
MCLDLEIGDKRLRWNKSSSKLSQKWRVIYIDTLKADPVKGKLNPKYGFKVNTDFYLQTALPSGRYLTRMDKNAFAIKIRNGSTGQIYFFDQKSKTIRLRQAATYQLAMGGKGTKKAELTAVTGAAEWFTHFKYVAASKHLLFIHENLAVDVDGAKDAEGQKLILHKKHNGANQKWNVIYASELKGEDSKTFNKQFGFYPGRAFILLSALPNHRRLTKSGAQLRI